MSSNAGDSSNNLIENFHYRPEVDGLRAVAVIAVILFHLGLGVPGGFVGVDVFFVISGYLITSLIIKDLERGTFTLSSFYERRARRIVPALMTMVSATLIAGWMLLPPDRYADLGWNAVFQSLFVANVYLWRRTGYFDASADDKPLLHTWSLAVEEQFYFIFPLFLCVLFRHPLLKRRSSLLSLLLALSIASFALSIYGVANYPSPTFYLLPTRAWELLLGSIISILPRTTLPARQSERNLWSICGLAGILIPLLAYSRTTPFPGLYALPPCLGSAIVIWINSGDRDPVNMTVVGRLLAHPACVFVGAISYSLYLWHWPLIVFGNYWFYPEIPLWYRLWTPVTCFTIAVLSWRFVETPFRNKTICRNGRSILGFALIANVVCIFCGLFVANTSGVSSRLPDEYAMMFREIPDALNSRDYFYRSLRTSDIRDGRLIRFGDPGHSSAPDLIVWGDSHAMVLLPVLDEVFKMRHLSGVAAVSGATAPVVGLYKTSVGLKKESIAFTEAVIKYAETNQIKHALLIAHWKGYDPDHSDRTRELLATNPKGEEKSLRMAILQTAARLKEAGCKTTILAQVPEPSWDVRKAMFRVACWNEEEQKFCPRVDDWNGIAGSNTAFIRDLAESGIQVIDPRHCFLAPDGASYSITMDSHFLYIDKNHLSTFAIRRLLLPIFENELLPVISESVTRQQHNLETDSLVQEDSSPAAQREQR